MIFKQIWYNIIHTYKKKINLHRIKMTGQRYSYSRPDVYMYSHRENSYFISFGGKKVENQIVQMS